MADAEREALLTAWVDRYSDSLLRMCFISLRDWALAEDALQETFIKAWRAMPQYEHSPIRNERAWLSRIAVNVCRDLRRTRWMRHVDAAQALEMLPPSLLAAEPEDRTLLLDILALPEKYRQVLILYHYQRLKKAEGMLRRELTEEVDGQ